MAKKKLTVANPAASTQTTPAAEPSRVAGYFSAQSIRETVESIVVAFILAFLFRTFEAEAFVIPTGSMAPTLMGQHKDLLCPTCGFRFQAGASSEAEDVAQQLGRRGPVSEVVAVMCPFCRATTNVDPRSPEGRQYPTFGGDRILVSKSTIDFQNPRRWDVTVFKYPGEAQTNYIKRLVGLPGETVRIWHGDLYFRPTGGEVFQFDRRPPAKLEAMAQIVYDNDYVVDAMTAKGWPVRWQPWPATGDSAGNWTSDDGSRSYSIDGSATEARWLGYRHFAPSLADWKLLESESLPKDYQPRPRLITDFYAYNTSVQRDGGLAQPQMLGLHWVGDLMIDCQLQVTEAEGKAIFVLVKGGRQFRCELDCRSGEAVLAIDGLEGYGPKAHTAVRGAGNHRVTFANFDEQLVLWIDGRAIAFDEPTNYPPLANDKPRSSDDEPGDLLPVRIGAEGTGLRVSHLRVLRDIYYIATGGLGPVSDYDLAQGGLARLSYDALVEFWSTPAQWEPPSQTSPFDERGQAIFPLEADQYFVLGDNSPLSQDARLWPAERYVARELLVGKALYVFWPHSFDKIPGTSIPLPFFPNFARMGFIK